MNLINYANTVTLKGIDVKELKLITFIIYSTIICTCNSIILHFFVLPHSYIGSWSVQAHLVHSRDSTLPKLLQIM